MSDNLISFCDFEENNIGRLRNNQLIDDISKKRFALVDVVERIGDVLTSDNLVIRSRGIDFLSWILTSLPPNLLTEAELNPVVRFFSDRLEDHHSLIPGVIRGILALVKSSNIGGPSVCDVLQKLHQFVVCQSQVVEDRYNIYRVVEECSKRHVTCVQSMGPDFMFGVISAMEGETDPKNLRLLFSFVPQLISQLNDIDHLNVDIIDVFSTYFPVDFTSVTKDGICITREDLAVGLSNCLTATPKLAAESLELILEKLDSSLKVAKIDSYILLQKCCPLLAVSQLEPSISSLWKMIRNDLIPPGPPSVQDEALRALTSIISNLDKDHTSLNRFLDDVIISIRSLLPKPNDSLFIPSMKILEALCSGSKLATNRVFCELEHLCKLDGLDCSEHRSLLASLLPFLQYHDASSNSSDTIATFYLMSAENSSDETRSLSFIALGSIIGYLFENDKKSHLFKALLGAARLKNSPKTLEEYYKLQRKIAEYSSESFFQEFYLPFYALYESKSIFAEEFFDAIGYIADVPVVTEVTIPHILTCISSGTHCDLALKALLFTCNSTDCPRFYTALVRDHNLLSALLVWKSALNDVATLSIIAEIVVRIMSSLEKEVQENLVQTIISTNGNHLFDTLLNDPLKTILLEGLIGGMRRETAIQSILDILRVAYEISKTSKFPEARYSAGRLLAALVNKMPETQGITLLEEVIREIDQSDSNKDYAIALMSWLLKGAVLRSFPGLDLFLAKWFSYLQEPRLSHAVAIGTQCIVKEEPVFLTTKTHCTIKFLYRQRLFNYAQQILQHSKSCDSSSKDNYYLVLITLAQGIPKSVLKSDPSVPIFVAQAMLSSNLDVVSPALNLLKNLLEDKSPIFAENITSLLPAIVRFVTYQESSLIRKLALNCVFLAGFYKTHSILPYKREVVKALLPCLDDKKRIVRKEAARARGRWCLVGAVGEEVLLDRQDIT